MKHNKTPLLLMEQMIMLLVFALTAVICLQAFVRADAWSKESAALDQAVILTQSAAETIRHYGGEDSHPLQKAAQTMEGDYDPASDSFTVTYDEDWQPDPAGVYILKASAVDSSLPGMGEAEIAMQDASQEKEIFRLKVAWPMEVSDIER